MPCPRQVQQKLKEDLWFFFAAYRAIISYIFTKFRKNTSKGFRVIERTQFRYNNLQRGINLYERSVQLRFIFSAYCLIMFYLSTKFHENMVYGYKVVEWILNITKNKIFVRALGGVIVLFLCISSDNGLSLYKCLQNILQDLRVIEQALLAY